MKKFILVIFIISTVILGACTSENNSQGTEIKNETVNVSPSPTELLTDNEDVKSDDGYQIIVNVDNYTFELKDPENGTYTILSYSVENPQIVIDEAPDLADKINAQIKSINYTYMPDDSADNVEMSYFTYLQSVAEDTYSLSKQSEGEINTLISFIRMFDVTRCDENVIEFKFENSYSGESFDSTEEIYFFDAKSGEMIDEEKACEYEIKSPKGNGILSISQISDDSSENSMPVIDLINCDEDGSNYIISISGTVYDIKVSQVYFVEEHFLTMRDIWYCSHISDSAIEVKCSIPQEITNSNLKLRYSTDQGNVDMILICGENGIPGFVLEDMWNSVG